LALRSGNEANSAQLALSFARSVSGRGRGRDQSERGRELGHPPLSLGRTIDKKIFHEVGALTSDKRMTATEAPYCAIVGAQFGFNFDYPILGAARRTLKRCGGGSEHVSIMRHDFVGG
jgi:hypothetical protein